MRIGGDVPPTLRRADGGVRNDDLKGWHLNNKHDAHFTGFCVSSCQVFVFSDGKHHANLWRAIRLTIDNPELEARLGERAAAVGVPIDAYTVEVLQRDGAPRDVSARLKQNTPRRAAVERGKSEREESELDAVIQSLPDNRALAGLGPLPDDAVADSYREREDAQL